MRFGKAMQPSNRIKLNRSVFRLETISVPKRRRTVREPRHILSDSHAADLDLAECDEARPSPPTPPKQEPFRAPAGDLDRGKTAHETRYDKGILPSNTVVVGSRALRGSTGSRCAVISDRAIRSSLRFALRFADQIQRHDEKQPQTEPGTVECCINSKLHMESAAAATSAPPEPTGLRARAAAAAPPEPAGLLARAAAAEPPVAAPHRRTGRPGASQRLKEAEIKLLPTRTSHFNKSAELKRRLCLVTRFGSGRRKRSVKSSCCSLCGDVKYIPPPNKKLARVCKAKSRHPDPQQKREGAKVRPGAQAQQKPRLDTWFGKCPKVNLCDVARVLDVTSLEFSCVLPPILHQKRKHKGVQCFQKEYMSLMRCYRHRKQKWIASPMWKVCAPTNSCASFSSGERVSDILVRHEGFPRILNNHVARILDNEGMTLISREGTTYISSNCDGVKHSGKTGGSAVASTGHEEAISPVLRVPPLVLRRVSGHDKVGSSDRFQCNPAVREYAEEGCCHLKENNRSEHSEDEECSPLSFSCQRTQAYTTRPYLSCARTYKSWPFPRCGPPSELKSSVCAGPQWILTTAASDFTSHVVSNVQTALSMTPGENVRENIHRPLRGSVESFQVTQIGQEQSVNLNKIEKSPSQFFEIPKDTIAECRENPSKAGEKQYIHYHLGPEPSPEMEFVHLSQQGPLCLDSAEKSNSEVVDSCSPKVFGDQDKFLGLLSSKQPDILDKATRPESVSLSQIKLVEQSLSNCAAPIQDIGLQQRAQQPLLPMLRPIEEHIFKTSSEMMHSEVEPQASSSSSSSRTDVRSSTDRLHPNKKDSVLLPPNFRRWKKQFNNMQDSQGDPSSFPPSFSPSFCTGEVSHVNNLSTSGSSEEVDAEHLLVQDEACKLGKHDEGLSSFLSPGSSVAARSDLDIMRAYEEDAIVLDVIQDDPELFGAVVMETVESQPPQNDLVAGEGVGHVSLQPKKTSVLQNRQRIVWGLESKSPRKTAQAAHINLENRNSSFTVESYGKAQGSILTQMGRGRTWTSNNPTLKLEQIVTDCNNNLDKGCTDVNINSTVNSTGSSQLVVDTCSVHSMAGISTSVIKPSPVSYCRYYFSEHYSCLWTMCRYLHLPRDEDEKFCMEIVQRFYRAGIPSVVQRAVEVFVGYYRTNSPGEYFNQNIVNSLLSTLLNLALLRDLLSVINTLVSHSRTPSPRFLVAVYEYVRERGLLTLVSELIFLTSKMMDAGCVFTVSQCEMMESELQMLQVPREQMDIFHALKCRALAMKPLSGELSVLSDAVVHIEKCKQQDNWRGLAAMFCRICDGRYSAGELSRFCCCVTTALLKEPKDKFTLPYETFAESVCQEVPSDGLVKSFLGRVGVSLMCTYHQNHKWTKGVKLVLVMSRLHVEFSKLKGLFGSEKGTSRCQLITIATELFLQSGSIEGALNVLRANEWFVCSSTWPCDQVDVENRKRVLTMLAGETSHRDTLEVLSNLPGLRQPLDAEQVGAYCSVFNDHLQKCMMNQVLLVAADTLDFMLTQGISAERSHLQNLIHKLGKQNAWNRARSLFKRAHSAGYYSEVLCEQDSLALPCSLSEIEMTLAFEMFITFVRLSLQNPSDPHSAPLLITLKRTSSGETVKESVYLTSGCRMLSAALIPNPKLIIRYVAVNQNQEQFFHLDRTSAIKWLSHNHTWAQEMWTRD